MSLAIKFVFAFVLVFLPSFVFASYEGSFIFPNEATTTYAVAQLPDVNSAQSVTLISSTTVPVFTVLYSNLVVSSVADTAGSWLQCGSASNAPRYLSFQASASQVGIQRDAFSQIVCRHDLILRTASIVTKNYSYAVTYVPFDITLGTTTPLNVAIASSTKGFASTSPLLVQTDISYYDWLFVASVLIFLLSFVTWGYFYNIFKPKK